MNAREKPPWWVRILLWGTSGRGGMLLNVWLSLAVAVVSFAAGFWKPRFFLGTSLVLSAAAYWAAVRWVDRHNGWPDKQPPTP